MLPTCRTIGIGSWIKKMRKKLLFYFFCFVCGIALLILLITTDDIRCYEKTSVPSSIPEFDVELDKPITDRNIFFHETSCFNGDGLILNARQACAVESAAKMNPKMNVYLLFISDTKISNESRDIFDQLQSYPNLRIGHIRPQNYMKDTPLDMWYNSGVLKKSKWPISHMSDILRYLTLWKYGGIYLDLDVVVIKSLEHLRNFAGAEDWGHVAAGVLGFDVTLLGRRMADACIRDMRTNFRGDLWGNNGPGVITRTLQKICSTKQIQDMSPARCDGFKVFPPSTFYPIHYSNWKKYFEDKNHKETMKALKNATVIHVWNKLSKYTKVNINSNVPYATIARKHCPKVFNTYLITNSDF